MTDETQQQIRKSTPEEDIRVLFGRVAKLNDAMSALLDPEWGARAGILPDLHPLHPAQRAMPLQAMRGEQAPAEQEQAAPVDWQAVVKRRERELRTVGEARHRAEQQRDRLAGTLDAALTSMELHWASADFHGTADEQVTPEHFKNWRAALEQNRRKP